MKQVSIKLFLFITIILHLFQYAGCTFRNDEIISPPINSAIEIFFPVTNSEIQQGITEVDYSITSPFLLKFIELYIDDEFIQNFPPNVDGTQPKIFIDLDTTYIGKSFSYFLIYYTQSGTSIRSEIMTNINVTKRQSLPSIPFDIKLLNVSDNVLNISWKDSSLQVDSFQVWRKTNFEGAFNNYLSIPAPAFNINDKEVDPDSIYFYKLRAVNIYGESDFSVEVNTENLFFTGNFLPPSNLSATADGSKVINLNWKDNSNNETYFLIERKTDFTEFKSVTALPENSTTYKDSASGLIPGSFYTFRIKSFSSNDSAWSNESRVQTYLYDIPAPNNLTGEYNSLLNVIILTWIDSDSDNSLFEIERKEETDDEFMKIASVSGAVNFFTDTEILANKIYHYRIRSSDGTVYSAYSNIVIVNTGI
ncbi:MAG TPA: fibronectin type III domain-containing protein [Ignavibacteriaceae bacterium]|nr:fibronectin type III domain-containing protein [Ignavibacteriaceae bacterium]